MPDQKQPSSLLRRVCALLAIAVRYFSIATATLTALLPVACHKALPPDAICSYEPLPASAQIAPGQGGIEVLASEVYYAVRDTSANRSQAST